MKAKYGLIEKESNLKPEDAIYDEMIGAGLGWLHLLKQGQSFRIVDLEGNQAVDTTFYDAHNTEDHYGAIPTIVAQKNIYLTTGSILRAESGKPRAPRPRAPSYNNRQSAAAHSQWHPCGRAAAYR